MEHELKNNNSKILEADILHIRDRLIEETAEPTSFCLIIHPSREQDLLDILHSYCSKPIFTSLSTIFDMPVYKDEKCPPNKIHILPKLEYLNMEKTLL